MNRDKRNPKAKEYLIVFLMNKEDAVDENPPGILIGNTI
jgi:hypothetical protein